MPSPVVVDLNRAGDPRDVIHEAVQRLAQGELVGLPTETSYLTAASAIQPKAVERLASLNPGSTLSLALPSIDSVWDYLAPGSKLAERIVSRCWPGPVVIECPDGCGQGLGAALAESVRNVLLKDNALRLRIPGEAVFQDILRLLPGPVVVGGETEGGDLPVTASSLVDRHGDALSFVVDAGASRYGQKATVVRIHDGRWSTVEKGVVNDRTIARLASEVYIFVCTGNTCRSPMAEALFRKMLAEHLKCQEDELLDRGYLVLSAGLSATPGMPAAQDAIELVRMDGVDLTSHGSQMVSEEMLMWADHVLTMTSGHLDALLEGFPGISTRARMLSAEGDDVADPIGCGPDEYRRCRDQIVGYLHGLISELKPS